MMQGAKGNIVRVFPRRTSATPDDPLAFSGPPPKGGVGEVDEIHISVAFTYDMEKRSVWRSSGAQPASWYVWAVRRSIRLGANLFQAAI